MTMKSANALPMENVLVQFGQKSADVAVGLQDDINLWFFASLCCAFSQHGIQNGLWRCNFFLHVRRHVFG
jgi:hypothetical protein